MNIFMKTNYFNFNSLFGLLITIIIAIFVKFITILTGVNPMSLALNGYIDIGLMLLITIICTTILLKVYLVSLHTNKFEFIVILGIIILALCISITIYFITIKLWSIDWIVCIPITGITFEGLHLSMSTNGVGGTVNGSGGTNGSGSANGSGNANGSGGANGSNSNGSNTNGSNTNGSNTNGGLGLGNLINYGLGPHGSGYLTRVVYYVWHHPDGHSGELRRLDGSIVTFDNFRTTTTPNGTIITLFYQNAAAPRNSIEVGTVITDSRGRSH